MKKKIVSTCLAFTMLITLSISSVTAKTKRNSENDIISAGNGYSAVIDNNSCLWLWGRTNLLGISADSSPIKVMENVLSVSCGDSFIAAIRTDGSLRMWGSNNLGQLGNSTEKDMRRHSNPVKIMENVSTVNCGNDHVAIIKDDRSLWTWGSNKYGQLGNDRHGNDTNGGYVVQTYPVKVLEDVIAVSCGRGHTAAVKSDGSLWMWGDNTFSQLGNDKVGISFGRIQNIESILQITPIKVMDNVSSVSCGGSHTAVIKEDGTL